MNPDLLSGHPNSLRDADGLQWILLLTSGEIVDARVGWFSKGYDNG